MAHELRYQSLALTKTSEIVVHFTFNFVPHSSFFVCLQTNHRSYLCNHSFYAFDALLVLSKRSTPILMQCREFRFSSSRIAFHYSPERSSNQASQCEFFSFLMCELRTLNLSLCSFLDKLPYYEVFHIRYMYIPCMYLTATTANLSRKIRQYI